MPSAASNSFATIYGIAGGKIYRTVIDMNAYKDFLNRYGTSATNSTVSNNTDKSITVNVNIDSISGSNNYNDINSIADKVEQVIVHKINMRGRAFA